MNEERITESPSWGNPRRQVMKTPDDVAEMLRLRASRLGHHAGTRTRGAASFSRSDRIFSEIDSADRAD
jgi:hypothetical protein